MRAIGVASAAVALIGAAAALIGPGSLFARTIAPGKPIPLGRAIPLGKTVAVGDKQIGQRLTAGGTTVAIARAGPEAPIVVTVSAPGMTPVKLTGEAGSIGGAGVGIGPLAKGQRPAVMFQSYTGGAHCCAHVMVAVPEGTGYRVVDFGLWDGGPDIAFPTDKSGDGVADFVFYDNAFLYAFASYAESLAPPLVMNIRGGAAVNVSADPAFRPLFAKDIVEARKWCLGKEVSGRNPRCAAYVADAARLGQFDAAWATMLKQYDRQRTDWPQGCKVDPGENACPDAQVVTYKDYPTALRAFLKRGGYINWAPAAGTASAGAEAGLAIDVGGRIVVSGR